ncbi:unnamed protein product [Parnassius apollo]|uniref:(apollo) hypothetical protein n=1 Tax=Parnassius apollo TaxID=110799 RepID=A0A8S3WQT1_PARAO|nr:unnamed protein product [Parnassius apollo]
MDLTDEQQTILKKECENLSIKLDAQELIHNDKHMELTLSLENKVKEEINHTDCNNEKLCRICLSTKGNLFTKTSYLYEDILYMYSSITSIEVNSDEVPFQICELCKNDLSFCYDFKNKCQKSDIAFKFLIGELRTEEEIGTRSITDYKVKENDNEHYDTKEELEEHEDIQYLDDINEFDDDGDDITLNLIKNAEQARQNNANISITDSSTFHKKISSKRNHKVVNAKKKSHFCSLCSKKFLKAKTLKAHIKSEHGSEKLPHDCDQCNESFNSEHDLRLHSSLHAKSATWICIECHKTFEVRSGLRRHIQRHMQTKRHECGACGKAFAERYALRRHARVHTGEQPDKRHACTICDKRYNTSALLASHMSRHSGVRPCVCSCGKSFPSQRLLASHRLVHSDRKPYACQYCDKTFRHESTRNTHHRTHTGEKPFICASCGKTFIQRSNLVLHMRTHTGERPYSCKMCDRKFASGSSLKTHVRTHTGDKPYACPVCEKRFARQDMRAHMAQHTGVRPHACAVCSKRFASAWRLRDHCRQHTGEKPYECAFCTDVFATKSRLMKHFKVHQNQKKSTEKKEEVYIVRELDLTTNSIIVTNEVVCSEDKKDTTNVDVDDDENTKSDATTSQKLNIAQAEKLDIAKNKKLDIAQGQKLDVVQHQKLEIAQDMPLEVTEEVVLQEDSDIKPEILVVQNVQNNGDYQTSDICLTADGVNFVNDINCSGDVNFVTVNEEGVSIASSAVLEGTTVKLYQLDQSLVQIHRSGKQLTISKVTSKMADNL